jgi:hypothetical protein
MTGALDGPKNNDTIYQYIFVIQMEFSEIIRAVPVKNKTV